MDWKYAHFTQESEFQAETGIVQDALRAFAKDWLADWTVSETPDGLEAKGYTGLHLATAKFHFEPSAQGTKVSVELQVKRASNRGFMLVDIGGYFNGLIRKWLHALTWWVNQKQAQVTQVAGQEVQAGPPVPKPLPGPNRLLGCGVIALVLIFVLWFIVNFIAAIVGLVTGNLDLPGGRGDITAHGPWARIVSALILFGFSWIAYQIWKPIKRNRGSGSSSPPSS
jgi:hypothetical protein